VFTGGFGKAGIAEQYSIDGDSWVVLPPMPIRLDTVSCSVLGNIVYLAAYNSSRLLTFNVETNTFEILSEIAIGPISQEKLIAVTNSLQVVECQ
jgi:hypothetical protein